MICLYDLQGIFISISGLQVLNLTGNRIEHIPVWIGRKLMSLQIFRIEKNNLQSVILIFNLKFIL